MTARTFVDSKILIYAHHADAGSKQKRAAVRLTELWKVRNRAVEHPGSPGVLRHDDSQNRLAAYNQRSS